MFIPDNKYDFMKFWSKLEHKSFDPIIEYNKTIENFVMHYKPSNQELFVIMVQLSRFFKEFAELEGEHTPPYKHPYLKGTELKEINLAEELQKFNDVYSNIPIPAVDNEEEFNAENNVARSLIKEKILAAKLQHDAAVPQQSQKQFYYYKRWIWIQFPWCCMDMYSNISQVMSKCSASTDYLSKETENELAVATIKILKDCKVKRMFKAPSQTPKKRKKRINMNKTFSAGPRPRLIQIYENQPPEVFHHTQTLSVKQEKLSEYNKVQDKQLQIQFGFGGLMKEITPDNVLQKLGNRVRQYSQKEILIMEQRNLQLSKSYNEFVNLYRQKKLQYEQLKTQLQKSQMKSKDFHEGRTQIISAQTQMESTYEQLNKAEVENRRLEQVIAGCYRNQAKNDEWIRSLENHISQIKTLIKYELDDIKKYKKKTLNCIKKMEDMKTALNQKTMFQNQTIDRVAEQFLIKTNMKESLLYGERRRKEIIKTTLVPHIMEYYKNKEKERVETRKKVQAAKVVLNQKLAEYKQVFEKIQQTTRISDPNELNNLLDFLEKQEELKATKERRVTRIQELMKEKESLEARLSFLEKAEEEQQGRQGNLVVTSQEELKTKVKYMDFQLQKTSSQLQKNLQLQIACKNTIEHLRRITKVGEEYSVNLVDPDQTLNAIGNKLSRILERVTSMLGTSDFKIFETMFPELNDNPKIICSNAENIRISVRNQQKISKTKRSKSVKKEGKRELKKEKTESSKEGEDQGLKSSSKSTIRSRGSSVSRVTTLNSEASETEDDVKDSITLLMNRANQQELSKKRKLIKQKAVTTKGEKNLAKQIPLKPIGQSGNNLPQVEEL